MADVVLSAPYGHACANCAQSKCKCIIRKTGGPCERCHRINKERVPSKTVRRRNVRKPAVLNSARIEEKLDSLATLIQAGRPSDTMIPSRQQAFSSYDADEPSPAEARDYLESFRSCHLKYFPFVYIPPTTDVQQLRQERPILWLTIMVICSNSTSQKQVLGNKFRERISYEMVFQSERNVDLLLGLLAFVTWSHYHHSKARRPFKAAFIQLAISLVFDLGLNKPTPKETHDDYEKLGINYTNSSSPRTLEERRAVLGCFLISSIQSTYLQKADALRWTGEMDKCIRVLDTAKECPTDEILIQHVQLQLISEKLALAKWFPVAMGNVEQPGSVDTEQLRLQLQGLKSHLLTTTSSTEIVLLHLHSTELEMTGLVALLQTNQITSEQQQFLHTGLESINSWYEVFFSISPVAYVGLPFHVLLQLARCLSVLYRLATLEYSVWGEHRSRCKPADAISISNRVISNFEQVASLNGLDNSGSSEGDIFSQAARVFQSFRVGWEAKLGAETPTLGQHVNEYAFPDDFATDFSDDWFTNLVVFPDY